MQTIQTEVKGIAKAVGASLKRAGHQVPHSVLLHALAAALDKRDWHKLKASLNNLVEEDMAPTAASKSFASQLYTSDTLGLLRLAYVLGRPVQPLPINDEEAQQAALAAIGTIAGTVVFHDLVLASELNPRGWLLADPDDTVRKRMGIGRLSFAQFSFTTPYGTYSVDAEYAPNPGWSLSELGKQELMDLLAAVPEGRLFPSGTEMLGNAEHLPPIGQASVLNDLVMPARESGPSVKAHFWTDDHRFEVDFDAQAYFAQAPVDNLLAIAEVGFRGDYCTDWVAEFMQGRNAEIDEGFEYISALQKANLRDPVGFECRVDSEDFYRWMDVHRRSELAQWLCVRADVSLSEADEPEAFGQWNWYTAQSACAHSFESQEAACLDAYDKLNLLQQALNDEL